MNQMQKSLQAIAKSLQELSKKIGVIQKQMGGAKKKIVKKVTAKAAKPRPVKKTSRSKAKRESSTGTAYDLFLKSFEDGNSGLSISDLKVRTGFDDKKVANLVYKAKKQGKIKNVGKGVYSRT